MIWVRKGVKIMSRDSTDWPGAAGGGDRSNTDWPAHTEHSDWPTNTDRAQTDWPAHGTGQAGYSWSESPSGQTKLVSTQQSKPSRVPKFVQKLVRLFLLGPDK